MVGIIMFVRHGSKWHQSMTEKSAAGAQDEQARMVGNAARRLEVNTSDVVNLANSSMAKSVLLDPSLVIGILLDSCFHKHDYCLVLSKTSTVLLPFQRIRHGILVTNSISRENR